MKKLQIVGLLAILITVFYAGYRIYPEFNKAPEIVSETIIEYDSIVYYLPGDPILIPQDTFRMPQDTLKVLLPVDTAAILQDYFTTYGYKWQRSDTNIVIDGYTTISQNRIDSLSLQYRWLQPVTTINNTVQDVTNYNRSISLGWDIPLANASYIEIQALYLFKGGWAGIGYTPKLKTVNINFGVPIIKFKN